MIKTGTIILALALGACAGRAPAIKTAEVKCLRDDLDALKAKLAAGVTDPGRTAIDLTEGELVCAFEALFASTPAPTPAPAQ